MSANERPIATYERYTFKEKDLRCPIASLTPLFHRILGNLDRPLKNDADEWVWEAYLEKVNASIEERMGSFNEACLLSGIPRIYVNVFTDGKDLRIVLRMSIISFPSSMNTGALFDWLKDFVLGCILAPIQKDSQLRIRIDDRRMTNQEVRMITLMLNNLNNQAGFERYITSGLHRDGLTSVFIDMEYLDCIGYVDYYGLANRIRNHYGYCTIKAYGGEAHREEWRDFLFQGIELVNNLEPPMNYRPYNPSYKLVIDASCTIKDSDRIVIVSGDRSLIQLCFAVHKAAKEIEFIIPDEQTDINFARHADKILDIGLNEYVMGVRP